MQRSRRFILIRRLRITGVSGGGDAEEEEGTAGDDTDDDDDDDDDNETGVDPCIEVTLCLSTPSVIIGDPVCVPEVLPFFAAVSSRVCCCGWCPC